MYQTFGVFRPHFDALARVAYFKIVMKPVSRLKHLFFSYYRFLVWVLVLTYNMQHVIRVIQTRHSTEQIVDTLFILLTTVGTLGKQVAFNVRSQRIDRLISVINGPLFASNNSYHNGVLKSSAVEMGRLLKLMHGAIFCCGTLWTIFPLINRLLGEEVQFSAYFPFDTSVSPTFELTVAYMSLSITFQAYGNVTMDCTIVAFYVCATTQLQMLRYDLENFVYSDQSHLKAICARKYINFRDQTDTKTRCLLQGKFVNCVERYRQIVWFVNEVESIFVEAMVLQFSVSAWVICMTMYKIVGLSILSAEFVSMAVYLCCMLIQLFMYCFYGSQLKVQSEFVNESLYCGDWLSLSPTFRRQLMLMMVNCSRGIAPRIAYVIPMSLETYVTVLRSSYTLFTFLNRK